MFWLWSSSSSNSCYTMKASKHSLHIKIHTSCTQTVHVNVLCLGCDVTTIQSPPSATPLGKAMITIHWQSCREKIEQCPLRPVNADQSQQTRRSPKETVIQTEHWDRGWVKVLQQWDSMRKQSLTLKHVTFLGDTMKVRARQWSGASGLSVDMTFEEFN